MEDTASSRMQILVVAVLLAIAALSAFLIHSY
jgi:hypothetical protein